MNKDAKDRHRQSYALARVRLRLSTCPYPYTLRMVRGIFVVKWVEEKPVGRFTSKEVPFYAALGPKGKVFSKVGSRQDTITAAGGRI